MSKKLCCRERNVRNGLWTVRSLIERHMIIRHTLQSIQNCPNEIMNSKNYRVRGKTRRSVINKNKITRYSLYLALGATQPFRGFEAPLLAVAAALVLGRKLSSSFCLPFKKLSASGPSCMNESRSGSNPRAEPTHHQVIIMPTI